MVTKDEGIMLDLNKKEGFSVHADADFYGAWFKNMAMYYTSASKSRTGYIITYGHPNYIP
eukprot:11902154-Ditylum_brightwellii.AAC.1